VAFIWVGVLVMSNGGFEDLDSMDDGYCICLGTDG